LLEIKARFSCLPDMLLLLISIIISFGPRHACDQRLFLWSRPIGGGATNIIHNTTTVAISKLKSNQHEISINLPMDQGKSSQGMEADNPSHPMVKEATAAKTPVTERIKWI